MMGRLAEQRDPYIGFRCGTRQQKRVRTLKTAGLPTCLLWSLIRTITGIDLSRLINLEERRRTWTMMPSRFIQCTLFELAKHQEGNSSIRNIILRVRLTLLHQKRRIWKLGMEGGGQVGEDHSIKHHRHRIPRRNNLGRNGPRHYSALLLLHQNHHLNPLRRTGHLFHLLLPSLESYRPHQQARI